jgi:hypothetical protein
VNSPSLSIFQLLSFVSQAALEGEDMDDEESEDDESEIEEPKFPCNEDELLYWAKLDREGWTIEEMLSQGLISVDSYPYFDDEPKETEEPVAVPEIVIREYTSEELEQLEIIYF